LIREFGKKRKDSTETISDKKSLLKHSRQTSSIQAIAEEKPVEISLETDQLILKEESAKGSVSWDVYKAYAESCSWKTVAIYLCIAMSSQALQISQNVFLSSWANENDKISSDPSSPAPNVTFYLTVYGLIGLSFGLATIAQVIFIWVYCGIRSSRIFHSRMLNTIARLPMSFFDTTPLGRITNRFISIGLS
jgi:ATP-binding cassette, subfamily C (CFTR/MRP), member 1